MKYNIFSNVVFSYFAVIITSLINLVSIPISVHYFGSEQFGLFSLTNDVLTYLSLLNFGIPWAISVIFSKLNRHEFQNRLIFRGMLLLLFFSIVAIIMMLLLNLIYPQWLSKFINIPNDIYTIAKKFIILSMLFFLLRLPISIFNQLLIFIHHAYLSKILDILICVGNLLVLLFIRINHYNLVYYAIFNGIIAVAVAILGGYLFFLKRKLYQFNDSKESNSFDDTHKKADLKAISYRHIISSGYYFFMNSIGVMILWNSSSIVIGHYLDLVSVAKYSLLFKIFTILFMAITQIMNVVNPLVAQLYNSKEYDKLSNLNNFTALVFPIIGGGIFILMFGFTRELISLWLHKDNLFAGNPAVFFVGLYCYFLCSTIIPFSALVCLNLSKHLYKFTLYEALINLSIALLLVRYLGLLGIAIALFLAHILTMFIFVPRLLWKLTDGIFIFRYRYILKNFLLLMIIALVIYLLNDKFIMGVWFRLVDMVCLGVIYLGVSFILMNQEQRKFIVNILTKKIRLKG